MAQIKFNSFGSTAAFGNFAPGDLLVCSDEQAKHFVEDAQCATYVQVQQSSQAPAPSARVTLTAAEKAAAKAAKKAAEKAAAPDPAPDEATSATEAAPAAGTSDKTPDAE